MKQMTKTEKVLIRLVCASTAVLALILAGCHSTESGGGDTSAVTNSTVTNATGVVTNSATVTNAATTPLLLDNGGNLASH